MREMLLIALTVWNIIVFVVYAIDKRRAQRHAWRVPEKSLVMQAIFGGGFGAFLAGKICHHKTRKWYFWLAWLVGLLIDVGLLVLILSYTV
ncbi:DUF1294 domain-containing protein [Lactococcus ileimucosae]|uniref:DUF1294 domain-containing protein n=1 Tax=Lactococcus ileimucosae TaxID=2941329 RepID=UPI00204342FA|nr:DUF1294 domain-containing protein [Lactococcus ileimucosae]